MEHWLVAGLVERLNAVVPSGYSLRPDAAGRGVEIWSRDGCQSTSYVADIADQDDRRDENVATAALNVLTALQDILMEDTTEPWPLADSARRSPIGAGTAVEDGRLLLWYGERDAPALRVPPVPIPADARSSAR